MFDDWGLWWGSAIALGIIVLIIQTFRKPQRMFSKKKKHVHVRTIKTF